MNDMLYEPDPIERLFKLNCLVNFRTLILPLSLRAGLVERKVLVLLTKNKKVHCCQSMQPGAKAIPTPRY